MRGGRFRGRLSGFLMAGGAILVGLGTNPVAGGAADTLEDSPFEVRRIGVNGKAVSREDGGSLVLPSRVESFEIVFAPHPQSSNAPVRFRYRLDGLQEGWQDTKGVSMRMIVRFISDSREILSEKSFPVSGQTPGWTGRFGDCTFVDRKEELIVPKGATRFWVVISSAGPPEAVGVYVVRDLAFSQPGITTRSTQMIPRLEPGSLEVDPEHSPPPPGWIRDGLQQNDAHLIPYGDEGEIALAIVDDGVKGHADWASLRTEGWSAVAGESLVMEWKEAYSISRGDYMLATYSDLSAGLYRFRMGGFTVMGEPTGVEASIPVTVPVALWVTPWFWSLLVVAGVGFGLAGWRFIEWRSMTRRVKAMERDHAVEQERVRIAQDIHDDLGARVTQISLLSSAAQKRHDLSEEAREDFEKVSQLSRNMVTALYETVWAVDPANDDLDELGAYICQMANQMCAQANLKCRLTVPDLPSDVPLGSKHRHDLVMTVKEAIHNAIRHSRASELQVQIKYENRILTLTVSDNGNGFDPATQRGGNGLSNMKRRMESCGGTCAVVSGPGDGTQVRLEMPLRQG